MAIEYRKYRASDSKNNLTSTSHVSELVYRKSKGSVLGNLLAVVIAVPIIYFLILGQQERTNKKNDKQVAEYFACQKDSKCWAEYHIEDAEKYCVREISKLSKYSVEWYNNILVNAFDRYRWRDQSNGLVTYLGDKVKFQNVFGAMENYVYECDMVLNKNHPGVTVQQVRARPGRL